MGGSVWSNDFYEERAATRAVTGKSAFDYHDTVAKLRPSERKVHAKMNPNGVKVRESRDSKEHPESLAIAVIFDHTASMQSVPMECQKQLPKLMGSLGDAGIKDPQILFGNVGDTTCDPGSLQIGQFESGIEMDEDLGRMWLVGGGGGQNTESYQNAIYFFARHTALDCFEKRNKKGYLFVIGDELPYPEVSRTEVETLFGDKLQENVLTTNIIKEAQEKFHVFYFIPEHTSNGRDPQIRIQWEKLLGKGNVLSVRDEAQICTAIVDVVAKTEGVERPATTTTATKKKADATVRL